MKLLMENWRGYIHESADILTEAELNQLIQEINALKSFLGRMRGGQEFEGGYGWEAAVEEWEDEDVQQAAQELGMADVDSKEDFVTQIQTTISKAQTSKNPEAQKAIQDLTTDIAQTAEPEPPTVEPKNTQTAVDPKPTGLWGIIDAELRKNKVELSDIESKQIEQLITSQMKNQNLSESLLMESGAWETLKHLASKLGRMEKGGKIVGRGKADSANKDKIEKALSKPAIKLIDDLRGKLESEYSGFPNNKGTTEFGMAVVEIWMVYDSIVNGVKKDLLEPAAANALIRALYDLVDRYKNYELSDVGRHFTENANTLNEKLGDRLRQAFQRGEKTDPITQAMYDQSVRLRQGAGDGAADAIPDAVQDIMNRQAAAGENAYLSDPAGWTGPSGLAPEGWVDAELTPGSGDAIENAVEQWVQDAHLQGLDNKGMAKSAQNAIDNLRKSMIDGGADPTVATDIAKASGDALTGQGDVAELAKDAVDAIKQIEPDQVEAVAQAIEKTIGSGATDLSALQVAGFWLQNVGLPAFLYSKIAIKLLRAKGKHSSREREITKLLDGIDVIPETSGFAGDETNISELTGNIAKIVDEKTADAIYKQLAKELRRMGYDKMVSENRLLKEEVIDLSMFKLPDDKRRKVGQLLLKVLRSIGADINLGGEILNAVELAGTPAAEGVSLAGISKIILNPQRVKSIKHIIYKVLKAQGIEVEQSDLQENRTLIRWGRMAAII